MRKLKTMFFGNCWAHSGGTKTFVQFKDSELLDIYMAAPAVGSLAEYFPTEKIIIIPESTRNELSRGFNPKIKEYTKDMDIVVDAMGSYYAEPPCSSLLYHIDNPIKGVWGVFGTKMDPSVNYPYDFYYGSSNDMYFEAPDNIPFNDKVHTLYCCIAPYKHDTKARDTIRDKLKIPRDAFVVGSTLNDDTMNRWVMTEFVRRHPETYFVTSSNYGQGPDRFGCTGIPEQFRCNCFAGPGKIDGLLSSFDVLIHTRMETFGGAVYEALAAGLPVVARWGGSYNAYAECMYPDAGYLAGHGEDNLERSMYDCVAALEHVYQNREEAKARGIVAKQKASRWFSESILPQYEKVFATTALKKGLLTKSEAAPYLAISSDPTKRDMLKWKNITRLEIETKLSKASFI